MRVAFGRVKTIPSKSFLRIIWQPFFKWIFLRKLNKIHYFVLFFWTYPILNYLSKTEPYPIDLLLFKNKTIKYYKSFCDFRLVTSESTRINSGQRTKPPKSTQYGQVSILLLMIPYKPFQHIKKRNPLNGRFRSDFRKILSSEWIVRLYVPVENYPQSIRFKTKVYLLFFGLRQFIQIIWINVNMTSTAS